MERLIALAESQGIYVAWRPLRRLGYYQHSHSLIVLSTRAPEWKVKIALAHELGHAYHGHDWTRDHDRPRDELEADMHAARLLITPSAYRDAEVIVGDSPAALAKELGVTQRMVNLRRRDFERDAAILATVEEWREEQQWAS